MIADVQVRAWRKEYADLLPDELLVAMDPEDFAAAWHGSLTKPKDARNRVLVALERNAVRGFAVTAPASDPDTDPVADGEIVELTVDPEHGREGHGSRLVQACAETLKADRFTRALVWLASTDDVRRAFLTEAGFAPTAPTVSSTCTTTARSAQAGAPARRPHRRVIPAAQRPVRRARAAPRPQFKARPSSSRRQVPVRASQVVLV